MKKVLHTFLCEKRKLKMVKKSQRTQEEKVLKQYKCACCLLVCLLALRLQKVLTF